MFIPFDNIGQIGIAKDAYPHELPQNAWSDGRNVRFKDNYAEKFYGQSSPFGDTSASANWILPITVGANRNWIYASNSAVYYVDPEATHTNITRQDVSGTAIPYTTTDLQGWAGGVLGGIAVMTSETDVPQYWAGSGQCAALSNWPTEIRCKVIRPHKSYVVALNITDTSASASLGHMVWWSQPAEPGTLPTSYDYSDPTVDAGRQDLAEDPTEITDGLTMGERFIVYKGQSYWAMDYIGAPYIWRFSKISSVNGALGKNCVAPVGSNSHAVFGNGDIYWHSGGDPTSILNARLRRWVFNQIDADYYVKSYAVPHPLMDEVWFAFASAGSTKCDLAAVWNYRDNTICIRDMPSSLHAASGVMDDSLANSWDSASGSWDEQDVPWNYQGVTQSSPRLVIADSANNMLLLADQTKQFNNVNFTAYIERTGLSLGSPEQVKLLKSVRPIFDAPVGTEIQIRVGAAMDIQSSTSWRPTQTYTVGTSLKIDDMVAGRYLAIRFESTGSVKWRLKRFDLEVEPLGRW